ncbi:spore coat U domain-containing protein [Rickettsia endosymbiont of Nabis limbatus]|uniref:Csu type fimbrial protein n=1 Tax=Rickettsia endosymbiont of Nabis limbatus TaxID=3066268 RepID=UPI003AF3B3C7
MRNNLKILLNIIAIGILILNSSKIFATATTNFAVTATVLPSCTVTATPLNFDPYTSQSNSDKTSTISVICTTGTSYHVKLDQGQHGTSTTARKMQGTVTSSTLNYFIYSDSARTINWGNNANNNDSPQGTGTGLAQTYTVYGRIPSGQTTAPADAYTDQIGVSITVP